MNIGQVSFIVTTYNNHETLEACLRSIAAQTYDNVELIIVDNSSTDDTRDIAHQYTDHVYIQGPERCAQRNYGVGLSHGEYVVIIDSDMELDEGVLTACVAKMQENPSLGGIIIPEESFGQGFWARCKKLERSFYVGIDWIEAARFFKKDIFEHASGYDESMVSGEDWDLSERIHAIAPLGRVTTLIRHNEGNIKLLKTLRKKSYYAHKFKKYTEKSAPESIDTKARATRNPYTIVLKRFGLFLSHPAKLFRNPALGFGVLFMKVCEYGYGAIGYIHPSKEG